MITYYLKEFKIFIYITAGFLKEKNIEEILNYISNSDIEIFQVLDAEKICSVNQILSAIYRTYRASLNEEKIAKKLSMEFLIRVTGLRNIKDALKIVGLNSQNEKVIIVCCDKNKEKIEEKIKDFTEKFCSYLDDKLIGSYKKEKLIEIYNLRTNEIEKEILMKISSIEYID